MIELQSGVSPICWPVAAMVSGPAGNGADVGIAGAGQERHRLRGVVDLRAVELGPFMVRQEVQERRRGRVRLRERIDLQIAQVAEPDQAVLDSAGRRKHRRLREPELAEALRVGREILGTHQHADVIDPPAVSQILSRRPATERQRAPITPHIRVQPIRVAFITHLLAWWLPSNPWTELKEILYRLCPGPPALAPAGVFD